MVEFEYLDFAAENFVGTTSERQFDRTLGYGPVESGAQLVGPTSIWGPGGPSTLNVSQTFGSPDVVGFTLGAHGNAGEVSGTLLGSLQTRYDDRIDLADAGAVPVDLTFAGSFSNTFTSLGAGLNVAAHLFDSTFPFNQIFPLTLLDSAAVANGGSAYIADIGVTSESSGSANLASPVIGPNAGLLSAQAGLDLGLRHTGHFTPTALTGSLVARHESGIVRATSVLLGAGDAQHLDLDLSLSGNWVLQILNLTIQNVFDSLISIDVNPFVQYTVGVGCGDPATDSDNGVFCVADDRATLAQSNVPLLATPTVSLPFNRLAAVPFSINVVGPTAVPEPSPTVLLAFGLAGLVALRGRRTNRRIVPTNGGGSTGARGRGGSANLPAHQRP